MNIYKSIDEIPQHLLTRDWIAFVKEVDGRIKDKLHNDRVYHMEMMLNELRNLKWDKGTRDALFIDRTELEILIELLTKELGYDK